MSAYVILTAMLFQRGSAESKDPDSESEVDHAPELDRNAPSAPRPVKAGGLFLWLYSYSLGIALTAFEIAGEVLEGARADAYVSVGSLMETALAVLCDRMGYDRRQSKLAIATRMALRDEHRDPSYTPSLHPDPVAQSARAEISRS